MRKVLMLIAAIMVALIAGQAAAADQPVVKAIPFIADQGDLQAASITAQAVTADRLIASATPSIDVYGNLWATVSFNFASLDIQNQWRSAGWPAYVDGVEVFLLFSGVLPVYNTYIFYAVPDASGYPLWAFAENSSSWTDWSSVPGVYRPYVTFQSPPPLAGLSGSGNVLIAPAQVLAVLPESPKDNMGNVNYNYGFYIMFDPIDLQSNFPADGILTKGSGGSFKFQGLMFFARKLNGQIQLYHGN